jgi:hypothetical protein
MKIFQAAKTEHEFVTPGFSRRQRERHVELREDHLEVFGVDPQWATQGQ